MNDSTLFHQILVLEDEKSKRVVSLDENSYSLGRHSGNSICIYDYQVSRYHATLIRHHELSDNDSFFTIIDGDIHGNKSRNGILVNGKKITEKILNHGDFIQFSKKAKAVFYVIDDNSKFIDIFSGLDKPKEETQEKPKYDENKVTLSFHELDNYFGVNFSEKDLIKLALFTELSPYPIIEINTDNSVTYLNQAARIKFVDIEVNQQNSHHPLIVGLADKPHSSQGSLFVREINMEDKVFEQYVHYLPESQRIRSYIFDYTQRKKIETALRESEEKYKAIIRHALEGIFLVDAQTKTIIESNQAHANLLGYSLAEMQQLTLYQIINSDQETIDIYLNKILQDQQYSIKDWVYKSKNGELIDVEVGTSLITCAGQNVFSCVVRDITARKQLEKRLAYRASHDYLTGLPNRNLFNHTLEEAIKNAEERQFLLAVMFIDLDYFKEINDSFGHDIGDELLKNFAKRLRACLRSHDTVARWGGDEFIILVPNIASLMEVGALAQRILDALKYPFRLNKHKLQISSSIGIALYPQHGKNSQTLLTHADIAVYATKKTGRNSYQFYSHNIGEASKTCQPLY